MNVKEVTIKQLVDIANKNWGYYKEEHKGKGSHIATILDILIGSEMPLVQTGNTQNLPCIVIWNPFVREKETKKTKIVGYYTLTKKEWKRLFDSNYLEETEKANETKSIENICKIAEQLYGEKN